MFIYWVMYFIPLIGTLFPVSLQRRLRRIVWFVVSVIFVTIIGLRHEVGGDWDTYLYYYELAANLPILYTITLNDPGYMAINWLAAQLGGGIYMVNTICAIIVVWGVFSIAKQQPLPWLALSIAVPYLLVVVSMGYTRQSVAIGFVLLSLSALIDRRYIKFYILVFLATLFHKTAIVFFVLPSLLAERNRVFAISSGLIFIVIAYYLFVAHDFQSKWEAYVTQQMYSEGGMIRLVMNSIPALLAIIFPNRLFAGYFPRLWITLSFFSIFLLLAQQFASTFADRFGLYVLPLQMVIFSRAHRLVKDNIMRAFIVFFILCFYMIVLWVWLNYAKHAPFWIPYKMYPFL